MHSKKPKYVIHFGNYNTPTKHAFTTKRAAQRKARRLKKLFPYIKFIKVRKV